MTKFLQEHILIGYFIGFSLILSIILLGVVYLISFTSKVDLEKSSAYECGFNRSLRRIIIWSTICSYSYYVPSFWYEILYLYPFCTSILEFNHESAYLILFFIIITLGLLYEISRNLIHFFDYEEPSKINYQHMDYNYLI